MHDRTTPLPLDGEILDTGQARSRAAGSGMRDDAEIVGYETVAAFARADSDSTRQFRARPAQDGLGVLRVAAQPESRSEGGEPLAGRILKVTGFIVAGAAFWINGGHTLFTGTAADNLVIASLESRLEPHAGAPMLRVDTRVENRGEKTVRLPSVLVSVHGKDGSMMRYKLGTSRQGLTPGGSHLFSGHVAAPTLGVDRVSVRLASTKDG